MPTGFNISLKFVRRTTNLTLCYSDHPNVDTLLSRGKHYPSEHPAVNPYIQRVPSTSPQCAITTVASICPTHIDIDATLASGAPPYSFPSSHPAVQPLLASVLPSGRCIYYYIQDHIVVISPMSCKILCV